MVLLIAFLVVGPKDLPRVARWLGRMVKKLRQVIRDVKKETGWSDLEKEFKDTSSDVKHTVEDLKKDLDVSKELKEASGDVEHALKGVESDLKRTGAEIQSEAMKKA